MVLESFWILATMKGVADSFLGGLGGERAKVPLYFEPGIAHHI